MTAINFSGLASGLDTDALIKGLMEVERQPLARLEKNKEFQEARLDAYKAFNEKLTALNTAVGALYLTSGVRESQISLSSDENISASVTSARSGNYEVKVEKLAQVQKSATNTAFASKTTEVFGAGALTLTVGDGVVSGGAVGADYSISINAGDNSLNGIMNAINTGSDTHGITASIIDNGNEEGDRYYLMLTGKDSSTEFKLTSSLVGGTAALSLAPPTQNAQDAVAYIDGIQVTSKTNTIKNAVNGVTLTLESVSPDDGSGGLKPTTMTVSTNTEAVEEKLKNFVTAYNDVINFDMTQSREDDDKKTGLFRMSDSSLISVKRRLQSLLVTPVAGNNTYNTLTQLGLSSNKKDGTISLDTGALSEAIADDFDEVVRLLAGDDNVEGVFKNYKSYLNDTTSSTNGLYATRKTNIAQVIDRIDDSILKMEARMEKRESVLRQSFTALEKMISFFNNQSEYLKRQMDSLFSLGGKD